MKRLTLLTITMIVLFTSCATVQYATEEEKKFEKLIVVPNVPKDRLFVEVNSWMVEAFVSPEAVIEFSDKEAGRTMGKYIMNTLTNRGTSLRIRQIVKIDIQDGKIRMTISSPNHIDPSNGRITKQQIEIIRQEWNATANSLVRYLNANINDTW